MDDDRLASALTDAGLARHASTLAGLARPSVRIVASRCAEHTLAPGASRFGGAPDLPPGFEWPSYAGHPHAFIAQLDLRALPHPEESLLPRSGWLVFFYEVESMKWGFDPADRGCAHVAWFDVDASTLVRTAPPAGVSSWGHFKPCGLLYTDAVDLADWGDLLLTAAVERMTDAEQERYLSYLASRIPPTYHHLLGHPQLIQNDMRLECELASKGINVGTPAGYEGSDASVPAARDWQLLLQVDTDEEEGPGWCWGDVGRIYFWIRNQDLEARRFEKTWLCLHCT